MKYFIDTEFLEGTQNKTFLGMNIGKTKPIIDLISIGIISEDNREYYAISKDFNLKEAWNRWQYNINLVNGKNQQGKEYWIRENVLKPIYEELISLEFNNDFLAYNEYPFSYSSMKYLIKKYSKSNEQITEEIKDFILNRPLDLSDLIPTENTNMINPNCRDNIQFYGYYADYDWVVFCWLFGKMIDLPKGFPMYCSDLKQELERLNETLGYNCDAKGKSYRLQEKHNYPKQTNTHNALADARWNYELYKFLNKL